MKQLLAIVVAGLGSPALAQTGVVYRVAPDSQLTECFCLGPCACPPHQVSGPMTGTFTLTHTGEGPLFSNYRVSSVDWVGALPTGAVRILGDGSYIIGGEVALTHDMELRLAVGADPVELHSSGLVVIDPQHPFPEIGITMDTEVFGCRQNTIDLVARPVFCYPDCDGSGALNVVDFGCFLNHFAARDLYANCDGSTQPPQLSVIDFSCYLNRFAAGCR